ncbi:MAG: iron ABC transporter ATP-binding protein [Anaerolinea sp.]|nr:iron ABC transporter ATP-binding protein [Anaerolinea sp.]
MSGLDVHGIHKMYENKPLLAGIDLQVNPGETICLLGASGSGKSTLLRIIAGLERADAGQILLDGQDITHVPAHQRHFGYMFQDYALFPHLTVADNIAFGLKIQRGEGMDIAPRVTKLLMQFNLVGFSSRTVQELSGGEQQRVALARTLAVNPRLLLLDEPLAALDRSLRKQLLGEIRSVLHQTGTPAIYVTHDQDEAYAVGDRLLLLSGGVILQSGIPEEVYQHPETKAVATFFGLNNQLSGRMINTDAGLRVRTAAGDFMISVGSQKRESWFEGMPVTLILRQARELSSSDTKRSMNSLHGVVSDSRFSEDGYKTIIHVGGVFMTFMLDRHILTGEAISLIVDEMDITILPEVEV